MGANTFEEIGRGKTAKEAFKNAREQAQYEHGHGGYSGTLAEKGEFIEIAVPTGKDPIEFARDLVGDGDERIDDKWGPAGCVKVKPDTYLFFGWASS